MSNVIYRKFGDIDVEDLDADNWCHISDIISKMVEKIENDEPVSPAVVMIKKARKEEE